MKFLSRHIKNTAVVPNLGQLRREIICSMFEHEFYVPAGGGYPGMPQAHCYRCGVDGPNYINHDPDRPHYVVPNSYSQKQRTKFSKEHNNGCPVCNGSKNDPDRHVKSCPICED